MAEKNLRDMNDDELKEVCRKRYIEETNAFWAQGEPDQYPCGQSKSCIHMPCPPGLQGGMCENCDKLLSSRVSEMKERLGWLPKKGGC